MKLPTHNIKIQHETFGILLDETFVDVTQFQLFLKMVQGSIALKNDLSFFNGMDFLFHIPYKHLVNSIVVTKVEHYSLTDHLINKSKIEALETR